MRTPLAILLLSATSLFAFPSLDAERWSCYFCRYPYPAFAANPEGGFQFAFPPEEQPYGYGQIHYVLTHFEPMDFTPGAISITFRVDSSPGTQYLTIDPPNWPATFRLHFETAHPNAGTYGEPVPTQFRSWWACAERYVLGSADGKTLTMVVPLHPSLWSSIYGVSGTDAGGWFEYAIRHIRLAGITFGNDHFYGHGVVAHGNAVVNVFGYQLVPNEGGTL